MEWFVAFVSKVGVGISEMLAWAQSVTGFVPAICTLIGVFYATKINREGIDKTILAADRRFINQLQFDSTSSELERNMSVRKDVYLEAAEGLVQAHLYLANISKGNVSSIDQGKALDKYYPALYKIEIIGTDDTIEQVTEMSLQFNKSLFEVMLLTYDLDTLKSDIERKRGDIEYLQQSFDRLIASADLGNKVDPQELQSMIDNMDVLHGEINSQGEKLMEVQLQMGKLCKSEAAKVTRATIPVVVSIRKELHLHFDSERYERNKNAELAKSDGMLDDLLAELKAKA